MGRQPIWAVSAWAVLICLLVALSSLVHGAYAASMVMAIGAAALAVWAAWLAHHDH
jgi:hypothetical protein